MSMPFYVSPEQLMKDRADFARKGIARGKSIVAIDLVETRPATTWNLVAPDDYGFFANVDPSRALARGSHSRETRIGESRKRRTEPFNGYGDAVTGLYQGMDEADRL